MSLPVLLVFSRHRWGACVRRSQQLMSRLAGRWQVVFVEEPNRSLGPARFDVRSGGAAGLPAALTVLVPHTPLARTGFNEEQGVLLRPLLAEWLQAHHAAVDMVWLTTPMAWPLAASVQPTGVVYDAAAVLADLPQPLAQLRQQEAQLLRHADLVLTGGPARYDELRHRHPHVLCLPNAVDAAHFAPACLHPDSPHARLARAPQGPRPMARLGFFGTVDERLDMDLLAALADAHTDWQVDMVGPMKHSQPGLLPQRRNLQWWGAQPYSALPYLMSTWDICLLPYRVDSAFSASNPSQTLEYLAGDKPVVSTTLEDVKALFSDAVDVVQGRQAFVQRCEELLCAGPAVRARRAIERLTTVSVFSWDRTALSVHELLRQALFEARARGQEQASLGPVAPTRQLRRLASGSA